MKKTPAAKLTAEQRRRVREMMIDEGASRAEAVAWVLAFEPVVESWCIWYLDPETDAGYPEETFGSREAAESALAALPEWQRRDGRRDVRAVK